MSLLPSVILQSPGIVSESMKSLLARIEFARQDLAATLLESKLARDYIVEQLLEGWAKGSGFGDILLIQNDGGHKHALREVLTELAVQVRSDDALCYDDEAVGGDLGVQHLGFVQNSGEDLEPCDVSESAGRILSKLHFLPLYLMQVSRYVEANLKGEGGDLSYVARLRRGRLELERSRQDVIGANTGLVAFVARKYKATSLSFDDLMQEGMVGLIRAVDRFDAERGVCFSTYAIFWIRQAISRLIFKQDKVVPLPVSLAEKSAPVFEAMRNTYLQYQRWPTIAELQATCDLSEYEIKAICSYYQSSYIDGGNGDEEDDGMSAMEKMRQHQFAQPLDELIETDLISYMDKAIASLPEKQASILTMRFGLSNHAEMTLQAVADHLQVTRERVRQIQNDALKKLKQQFGIDLMLFLEPKDT